ncbi:MAG: prepilin-type N-terminal cleavage/methylation domain-containing protein [Patescibacteria group bacterium]
MKKLKTKFQLKAGFTLVETLMAISILVLAVTGAFSAAHSGITSAIFSKDQIVAFYLAQEGIEQIRNMRDENGLRGQNWLTNIAQNPSDPCYFAVGARACRVDVVNDTIASCGAPGSCPFLKLDPVNGFYSYVSGNDTRFKREISLSLNPANGSNEVVVSSIVSWSKGLINRSFTAREIIFNWQ